MDRFRFLLVYLLPIAVVVGLTLGGPFVLGSLAIAFVAVPLFDLLLGARANGALEGPSWLYEAPLLLWLPVQLATMAWAIHVLALGELSTLETIGGVLSLGVMAGGGGINVAHELMHRPDRLRRGLAETLMSSVLYAHFCVEHVLGHHRNVATPADPATSRLGETVYQFLPRTLLGGLRSAWRLERERCARRSIHTLSLRNRRLRHLLIEVGAVGCAGAIGGAAGAAVFVGQALTAVLLLEVINYVEHYGLQRAKLPNGRYERVRPRHSWNSDHVASSSLLFQLTHHSDHHATASLPYYSLRSHEDAPQLPSGYGAMTMVALVPPLWRRMMDGRVPAPPAAIQAASQAPAPGAAPAQLVMS
jgi:alkane 1-monooxygenase